MISLLQRAEIRRLFYAEHWPIGTIADALGVHHETVRRAINRDRGIHPGPQIRPSALDPYKAFIATTLEQYPRPARHAALLGHAARARFIPAPPSRSGATCAPSAPRRGPEAYFRLDTLAAEHY